MSRPAPCVDTSFLASIHDLRHIHAQMLLEAGVPLETVSRCLGHSSIAITHRTYQHWCEASDQAAAEALAAVTPW